MSSIVYRGNDHRDRPKLLNFYENNWASFYADNIGYLLREYGKWPQFQFAKNEVEALTDARVVLVLNAAALKAPMLRYFIWLNPSDNQFGCCRAFRISFGRTVHVEFLLLPLGICVVWFFANPDHIHVCVALGNGELLDDAFSGCNSPVSLGITADRLFAVHTCAARRAFCTRPRVWP
jgi:hypothetical protein